MREKAKKKKTFEESLHRVKIGKATAFFIISFIAILWIYSNNWIYVEQQIASIPTWPPIFSIVPTYTLGGSHIPFSPTIGEKVLFRGLVCDITSCIPCANCSVEILQEADYVNKIEFSGYFLNETGEIEFFYNSDPTWIKISGYNAILNYRIPKPSFLETIDILLNKWPLSLAVKITGLVTLVSVILSFYYGLKSIYKKYKERRKSKKQEGLMRWVKKLKKLDKRLIKEYNVAFFAAVFGGVIVAVMQEIKPLQDTFSVLQFLFFIIIVYSIGLLIVNLFH